MDKFYIIAKKNDSGSLSPIQVKEEEKLSSLLVWIEREQAEKYYNNFNFAKTGQEIYEMDNEGINKIITRLHESKYFKEKGFKFKIKYVK